MTRSTWSGGVTWSGTAKWMPDGATASGPLMVDVALAGHLYADCTSARWRLGIPDFLSPLSPGTATATFVGYFAVSPGDTFVITSPVGTHWVGRVDTCSTTWDDASNAWTTVTGTDVLGMVGAATLEEYTVGGILGTTTFPDLVVDVASTINLSFPLALVDDSSGMGIHAWTGDSATYTGGVLDLFNRFAKSGNVMLALHRDGTIHAVIREAVTPSDQVDITDRYNRWTQDISIDVDINYWSWKETGSSSTNLIGSDVPDINTYGKRTYEADPDIQPVGIFDDFADWTAYGGSQRPRATMTIPLTGWGDDDVMLLDPFDWVTESSTGDLQVLMVEHDATPDLWTVTLTTDNLLDLL